MSNPGRIVWDKVGERFFETGLDRGVVFPMGSNSQYGAGVAWNGLTAVNDPQISTPAAEAAGISLNTALCINVLCSFPAEFLVT